MLQQLLQTRPAECTDGSDSCTSVLWKLTSLDASLLASASFATARQQTGAQQRPLHSETPSLLFPCSQLFGQRRACGGCAPPRQTRLARPAATRPVRPAPASAPQSRPVPPAAPAAGTARRSGRTHCPARGSSRRGPGPGALQTRHRPASPQQGSQDVRASKARSTESLSPALASSAMHSGISQGQAAAPREAIRPVTFSTSCRRSRGGRTKLSFAPQVCVDTYHRVSGSLCFEWVAHHCA